MIGMKDQCFGVEVEMTGLTRRQAAQALANYFGTEPYYVGGGYDKWSVKDPDGKAWSIMSDSSIVTEMKTASGYIRTGDIEYRVEMVTPKLTYAELPRLQECVRQVRHAGAKVNHSCGIHVHVDAANHRTMPCSPHIPLHIRFWDDYPVYGIIQTISFFPFSFPLFCNRPPC